jgi:pimeloyl-ACP methyl ester carboxylesterase
MTRYFRSSCIACVLVCCCTAFITTPSVGDEVRVNGMTMYYEIHGEGEPLLLVQGYFSSGRELWAPFVRILSAKYRLVIPDLRGHGRSTNPQDIFSHRQCSLDMYALLDHLGVDEFKAMGISSGGMTLLHMATQQPERVTAMVVIGTTHNRRFQSREPLDDLTVEKLLADDGLLGGLKRLRRIHAHGDGAIRKMARHFLRIQDDPDDMPFSRADLKGITARVLIMQGDRDPFFPVEIAVKMYRQIPNSSLWIVPNGGHVPYFSRRVPFTRTTLGFLDEDWNHVDIGFSDPVHPWGAPDDVPEGVRKKDLHWRRAPDDTPMKLKRAVGGDGVESARP